MTNQINYDSRIQLMRSMVCFLKQWLLYFIWHTHARVCVYIINNKLILKNYISPITRTIVKVENFFFIYTWHPMSMPSA